MRMRARITLLSTPLIEPAPTFCTPRPDGDARSLFQAPAVASSTHGKVPSHAKRFDDRTSSLQVSAAIACTD